MTTHFAAGFKYVNGREVERVGFKEFLSSNGVTRYMACMWADGEASCNCPGWATSKKTPKSCRHSRDVRSGDAVLLDAIHTRMDGRFIRGTRVEVPSKKRKIIL